MNINQIDIKVENAKRNCQIANDNFRKSVIKMQTAWWTMVISIILLAVILGVK